MPGYNKNVWVDQEVERPRTYEMTNNSDGSITLTDSFGLVSELGTPVNADNMNHIEEGIENCELTKWNENIFYSKHDMATYLVDDVKKVFISLKDENQGHLPTDSSYWEEKSFGSSGQGAYLGQTIFSLDPLNEDTLHLQDGSLLSSGGIYDSFIQDYILPLTASNPERFITEDEWQESVELTGICNKYVYTEGVGVRLPKLGNYLNTTQLDSTIPVIGNGPMLISGSDKDVVAKINVNSSSSQRYLFTNDTRITNYSGISLSNKNNSGVVADTANENAKLIQGYYYIVVAAGSKTDIEADLDNIATDLNNKADLDLTNVNNIGKSFVSHQAMPSDKYIDLTLGASGSLYAAPADGYISLVYLLSSNQQVQLVVQSSNNESLLEVLSTSAGYSAGAFVPVRKGQKVLINYSTSGSVGHFRFVYAIGTESEAQ